MEKRDAIEVPPSIQVQVEAREFFSSSFHGMSKNKTISFIQEGDFSRKIKKKMTRRKRHLEERRLIEKDDNILGVLEESGCDPLVEEVISSINHGESHIEIGRELYLELATLVDSQVNVNTKYKTVDKKIRPAAIPLPLEAKELLEKAKNEPPLRDKNKIGHVFTKKTLEELQIGGDGLLNTTEIEAFRKMISKYGKAFAFTIDEMGCVDPRIITPMIIFTVPHVPWDLKPLPIPRALIQSVIDLLKEKMRAKILTRSNAPYSNRWFTVMKKNGKLRFIQDMQPSNQVTIRNVGTGPTVDEFAEEFAGRAIYSIGDLISSYDQFQLAESSRDITKMRTPLGLMKMCTLPQGGTNSVAHMQNAMNRILQAFIPEKTRPFLDDMPIKGCKEEEKDETLRKDGLREFVWNHLQDVEAILKRLIEVGATLSGEKSFFGLKEILVVGQICGSYGRRPNDAKVEII